MSIRIVARPPSRAAVIVSRAGRIACISTLIRWSRRASLTVIAAATLSIYDITVLALRTTPTTAAALRPRWAATVPLASEVPTGTTASAVAEMTWVTTASVVATLAVNRAAIAVTAATIPAGTCPSNQQSRKGIIPCLKSAREGLHWLDEQRLQSPLLSQAHPSRDVRSEHCARHRGGDE